LRFETDWLFESSFRTKADHCYQFATELVRIVFLKRQPGRRQRALVDRVGGNPYSIPSPWRAVSDTAGAKLTILEWE
jgi:hypothetical protein